MRKAGAPRGRQSVRSTKLATLSAGGPNVSGAGEVQVAQSAPRFQSGGPLGSVNVDLLEGEDLRNYARRAGVFPRDIESLSEDRLRQNIKLVIQRTFDLINEG